MLLEAFFLACVALLPGVSAQFTFSPGPCPLVRTKSDFDLNQYLGLWYERQRFPNPFEKGLGCVQAFYSRLPDKLGVPQVKVVNAGILENGATSYIEGSASPSLDPGTLKVRFPNSPFPAPYKVLETDYTTYSAVYSCVNFVLFKLEFAWVLVRDPQTFTTTQLAAANRVFTVRSINITPFVTTNQNGCDYVLDSQGQRRRN